MLNKKEEFKQVLLRIIAIHNRIVEDSKYFDVKQKEAFINLGNYTTDMIQSKACTLSLFRSSLSDMLVYWRKYRS